MKAALLVIAFVLYMNCDAQVKEKRTSSSQANTVLKEYVQKAENHLSHAEEVDFPNATDSALYYARKAEKLSVTKPEVAQNLLLRSKILAAKYDMPNAHSLAQKALDSFSSLRDNEGIGDSYVAMAESKETDPVEYASLYEKASTAYKKARKTKKEAFAVREMAFWTMNSGDMAQGKKKLDEALALYRKAGDPKVQKVFSLMAITELETGNLDKAIEYSLKAAKLIDASAKKEKEDGEIYNYTGIAYTQSGDYGTAGRYFKSGYEIASRYNDQELKIMVLANLIANTMSQKKYKEALGYLKPLENDLPNMPPPVQDLVISRSLLAYSFINDFKSAQKYAALADKKLASLAPDDQNIRMFLPGLVTYYFGTKQYDKSKKIALRYRDFSIRNKDKGALQDIYRRLSQIDSAQNSHASALENYRLYKKYSDSLTNEKVDNRIAELQVQYETEKKDNAIKVKDRINSLLTKESELQRSELSKTTLVRNLSFAAVTLLLFIVTLLILRYRGKQKTNRLLESQKNEINLKNTSLEKLVDEKEWLLKEIHHRVKNNLQMVMSLLNAQTHYLDNEAAATAIRDSQHRIHSMSLIHKKLYMSDNVTTINMSVYIGELIDYFKQIFDTGTRIKFITEIEPIDLDTSHAVPIGLIINECITNSVKYAFPDNAEGQISIFLMLLKDDVLKLQTSDDGIGMNPVLGNNKISLGLKLIRGLADDLDAKLDIATQNGVRVSLEFQFEPVPDRSTATQKR
ncbi:hypothetical protein HUK80_13805 [Flavobacterium sp. MAH-1]|uniref:histidine kinase n=1 Tax=Flavobacterium agri TaxID=2743471 RepID=A0A7Y8Y4Z2_9FLAO|nr:histidine kinase dimerization/phosphoacceptor domain -containing protein [Flavobacterium agri]NUY81974.1 hypothetical protein [Flavobacterium agri]NYA71998.1 hypothetical protein [Flavobacterium agri]